MPPKQKKTGLDSLIEEQFRLLPIQKNALKKMGILTIKDLIYYFPVRYGDIAQAKAIKNLVAGESATVFGKIVKCRTGKAFTKKTPMAEVTIGDGTGKIKAIWFHQPYIAKMLEEGKYLKLQGKITGRKNIFSFINPEFSKIDSLPTIVGDSIFGEKEKSFGLPVYPETRGISSKWIFHVIQKIFKMRILDSIIDPIPVEILKKYNLPTWKTALIWIHSPQKEDHAISARKRFAFEEIFFIQLEKQKERIEYRKKNSFNIDKKPEEIEKFISRFPFLFTTAQNNAIEHILKDFSSGKAMSRLLEGDVGSGKTAVAATTVYASITTRPTNQNFGCLQCAYMAPTEILANQHFESFIKYFSHLPINIGLITSSGCKKFPSKVDPCGWTKISKNQLLKWVSNGEIPIIIGTHSLIQKAVKFKNLAYVIIDEQHRFGTVQRQKLKRKDNFSPHLLSMTATPIPRTLALTLYGDLDLTLIDEMPEGRKKVITEIVLPNQRENTYKKVEEELKKGRQVFVICPRIDEPDPDKELALNVKSIKEEAKRLKEKIFPKYSINILHGKLKPSEKEKVMTDFFDKKIDILVATSVVEVGINVPNATVIIIEGAERFGLAQLHQLRGRVIRSNDQSFCYVFADTKSDKTIERLRALKEAKNGFELAEYDLKFRGAGGLYGKKQWGVSDIAMEALKNLKMVEAARNEAQEIIEKDPNLKNYPVIKARIENQKQKIHFE